MILECSIVKKEYKPVYGNETEIMEHLKEQLYYRKWEVNSKNILSYSPPHIKFTVIREGNEIIFGNDPHTFFKLCDDGSIDICYYSQPYAKWIAISFDL